MAVKTRSNLARFAALASDGEDMVVEDKMGLMAASRVAAKANLFSEKWGARQVRHWTQQYVKTRALPRSRRGLHAKAFSIFNDPAVRAAICGYMRSNKWSLNPVKLRQLMKNELERDEATAYAQEIVSQEMPRGLKKYVEEVGPFIESVVDLDGNHFSLFEFHRVRPPHSLLNCFDLHGCLLLLRPYAKLRSLPYWDADYTPSQIEDVTEKIRAAADKLDGSAF